MAIFNSKLLNYQRVTINHQPPPKMPPAKAPPARLQGERGLQVRSWAKGVSERWGKYPNTGLYFALLPSGYVKIAIENGHWYWIYPLKMMIFHRYVSLPEGSMLQNDGTLKCNENDIWPFRKQQIWIRTSQLFTWLLWVIPSPSTVILSRGAGPCHNSWSLDVLDDPQMESQWMNGR